MLEFIISCIGFILLWVATDIGRTEEDKIKLFSLNGLFVFVLITVGVLLIQNAHRFFLYLNLNL